MLSLGGQREAGGSVWYTGLVSGRLSLKRNGPTRKRARDATGASPRANWPLWVVLERPHSPFFAEQPTLICVTDRYIDIYVKSSRWSSRCCKPIKRNACSSTPPPFGGSLINFISIDMTCLYIHSAWRWPLPSLVSVLLRQGEVHGRAEAKGSFCCCWPGLLGCGVKCKGKKSNKGKALRN